MAEPESEKEITIPDKEVGNRGNIGRIYLPKVCIGRNAKLIIPFGSENEVIFKVVGKGRTAGVLYVHKKHIGKIIKIIILPEKRGGG